MTKKRQTRTWLVSVSLVFLACVGVGWSVMHSANRARSEPLAVASPSYGIAAGGGLPYKTPEQLAAYMNGLKELGVEWVRFDLDWSTIQPRNGHEYNWAGTDAVAAAANAAGLKSLGVVTYTPKWARASICANTKKCPPADPERFAVFAVIAARRYAPQGMQAWEIWNEPNSRIGWAPAADASAYVKLLKPTYTMIHRDIPHAIVVTGGLARVGNTAGNIQGPAFLAALYANRAKGSFDAVGVHPYSYPFLPTFNTPGNSWALLGQSAYNLRDTMKANGEAYKKVWVTEYGAPTDGPGRAATTGITNQDSGSDHVPEGLQAALVSGAIQLYKNDSSWMGPFFWHSFQDNGSDRANVENAFGLLRYNGTQKPAYSAFKEAIQQ